MKYRPRQHFGNRQPGVTSQNNVLRGMIFAAPNPDALPSTTQLAHMYRCDPKQVEAWIGARRRQLHEAGHG